MTKPNPQELAQLQAGKVFVAGHNGMVGKAIVRRLQQAGCTNLLVASRAELDLENQAETKAFILAEKPDFIFLAAARVGGIHANNTYPAQFIYRNLMIAANIINAAYLASIRRLLFLGSSCIYPRLAPQPLTENSLLTAPLELSNEPYAIAKIAGIKLCESYNREYGTDFRSVMPTNLYGPDDNFDLQNSHVLPALLAKFHAAKINGDASVEIWGTGTPKREFLHVDDLADACLFVACLPSATYKAHTKPQLSQINIGCGTDISIAELARIISAVVGFSGKITYNDKYPDGTMRKVLDISILSKLGWKAETELSKGISRTYQWYLKNHSLLSR